MPSWSSISSDAKQKKTKTLSWRIKHLANRSMVDGILILSRESLGLL
jgi:hypothetical protein